MNGGPIIDKNAAFSISIVVLLLGLAFWLGIMYSEITSHRDLPYHIGVGEKFVQKDELVNVVKTMQAQRAEDIRYLREELNEIKARLPK